MLRVCFCGLLGVGLSCLLGSGFGGRKALNGVLSLVYARDSSRQDCPALQLSPKSWTLHFETKHGTTHEHCVYHIRVPMCLCGCLVGWLLCCVSASVCVCLSLSVYIYIERERIWYHLCPYGDSWTESQVSTPIM